MGLKYGKGGSLKSYNHDNRLLYATLCFKVHMTGRHYDPRLYVTTELLDGPDTKLRRENRNEVSMNGSRIVTYPSHFSFEHYYSLDRQSSPNRSSGFDHGSLSQSRVNGQCQPWWSLC